MKSVFRRTVEGTVLGFAMANLPLSVLACTSMIFQAQDGTNIYARTMEWGQAT